MRTIQGRGGFAFAAACSHVTALKIHRISDDRHRYMIGAPWDDRGHTNRRVLGMAHASCGICPLMIRAGNGATYAFQAPFELVIRAEHLAMYGGQTAD